MAAVGQGLREAFERVTAMMPAATDLLSDDQLVGFAQAVEALVRQADALSIAVAREFDHRTDETLGEDSLARRLGARKAWGALETVTRTCAKDARERVL
ncbi:hypothetical protein, partial [Gryllotalpicola kribbensis]|uniref:hypothetical protein n=1 Tax=Gryllotalpicola kribbensis TaxID=993084 RepID=UPI0031D90663